MRRTALSMTSFLRPGQILRGRTNMPYELQKVLYERLASDDEVPTVRNTIWLATYVFYTAVY